MILSRLYTLIEEFDRPFSSDLEQIPLYKRDLHRWVEDRLGLNLQNRLHSALYSSLNDVHREIKERVKSVLANEERKGNVDTIVPRSDFAVSYRLDCSNLCSDFREDIQFKFSLGLSSLWQRFVQNQTVSMTTAQYTNELSSSSSSSLLNSTNEILTTANNISALTSKSGLLALGAGALVWRGVGWKVLGVVATVYGSFYAYERLMWTKKAQERAFKRQYADYASSKMRLIVDMTSGNASAQVQQELSMYFAQTIRFIDMEKDDLTDSMKQAKVEINHLYSFIEQGKKFKKQGEQIDNSLTLFAKQYLSSDSSLSTSSDD
jgi:mitofusin 2